MNILRLDESFRNSVDAYIRHLWSGPKSVALGELYDTSILPGFVVVDDGALLGAALYRLYNEECEVSVLFSLIQKEGVGTKLLDAVIDTARQEKARRVWLVTTNDNTQAIRFYQKYGFSLKAVHIGSFEVTRKLKDKIPEVGIDNIRIEHEFEFEILL